VGRGLLSAGEVAVQVAGEVTGYPMNFTPPHLEALEEVERNGMADLVEVLREEGLDGVRYALWDATGWRGDYSQTTRRNRATEEQKRVGWEMAVRIEKIIAMVLHEAHERHVEETMDIFSKNPEGFCK
jgi:hypothetical protein